ncbi:MAG: poly-gamma-glutamate hydrolase family protein [Thermodesulfobacteriota bacterium]|nr:poly-gamma-glutamate hydrolase family protein [Thermodesulfobacteriota bacterium]
MSDKYKTYAELRQNEKKNKDYTILYREGNSEIAVIAPHGGGIEPGTIDIADKLAGCNHTFYAFKGLKKTGNRLLHITSNRFDEPLGVRLSQNASTVISIHGSRYRSEIVHIGGRHQTLKQNILHALTNAGFNAEICTIPGLRGISPENICNRCRSGKGVQLEISRGLRDKLFDNLDRRKLRKKTKIFYKFVNALKNIPI